MHRRSRLPHLRRSATRARCTATAPSRHPLLRPAHHARSTRSGEAIATAYYRHVSPSLLALPTIEQILTQLGDPYTEYLSPDEYGKLEDRLTRTYYGVGLTVSPAEDGLMVTSSLRGPAREAGIRPGDVIVSIDGRPTAAIGFERAVQLMVGERGTIVHLTVLRPGAEESIALHGRAPARAAAHGGGAAHAYRGPPDRPHPSARVLGARRRAPRGSDDQDGGQGAEALVLDLRGNPGGLLAQAIRVTSLYLEAGEVGSTAGANQEARLLTVGGAPVEPDAPMAVLVDDHTASAAEIVAAALRDNKPGGRRRRTDVREDDRAVARPALERSRAAAHDRELHDAEREEPRRSRPEAEGARVRRSSHPA